jgi:hypothetical protein
LIIIRRKNYLLEKFLKFINFVSKLAQTNTLHTQKRELCLTPKCLSEGTTLSALDPQENFRKKKCFDFFVSRLKKATETLIRKLNQDDISTFELLN